MPCSLACTALPPLQQAYEILELYLELLTVRTQLLAKTKEIPRDMIEAVSSIIYSAQRVPDTPELGQLRQLFASKYGKEYAAEAEADATAAKWQVGGVRAGRSAGGSTATTTTRRRRQSNPQCARPRAPRHLEQRERLPRAAATHMPHSPHAGARSHAALMRRRARLLRMGAC